MQCNTTSSCIMSSGRTGWGSACFCRDGDIFPSWDSQTWHVHVAVLPRRHSRPRRQGQGKGSRSIRVESSRILGGSSWCNVHCAIAYTFYWFDLRVDFQYTLATQNHHPRPLYRTTTSNLREHHLQQPHEKSNRQHGLIRQELHPGPGHGLPPHWHHCCRHHGRQRGGRCRRTD